MEISYSEYLTLKEIVGRYESKSKPNPNHSLPNELLDKEIWELDTKDCMGTSVRLYNVMRNGMGLKTVRDMIELSVNDFLRQRNFGKKCLKELKEIYDHNGIKFVE
jgi:DNA-directed RNA polymerase alpha subunit